MNSNKMRNKKITIGLVLILTSNIFLCISGTTLLKAQSLDFPSKEWGISFGNSKNFTGLRFNFRDSQVREINGVNITFWQPEEDNKQSVVHGLSLGLIPGAGTLQGLQIGAVGVAAEREIKGNGIHKKEVFWFFT